ncbi:MAG: YciI family protein [Saprospiraceae bacterium]
MRSILTLTVLLAFSFMSKAQNNKPEYDAELAKQLGADEYGMKMYVFAILKTGPNTISDKKVLDSLFAGHMNNIKRLADIGKLSLAGPFGKNDKTYRGLFILNVSKIEEATELLQTDPTIKEKVFEVELYPWYGSAALSQYLPFHEKIQKSSF